MEHAGSAPGEQLGYGLSSDVLQAIYVLLDAQDWPTWSSVCRQWRDVAHRAVRSRGTASGNVHGLGGLFRETASQNEQPWGGLKQALKPLGEIEGVDSLHKPGNRVCKANCICDSSDVGKVSIKATAVRWFVDLAELDLSNAAGIGNIEVMNLTDGCPQLRSLGLGGCRHGAYKFGSRPEPDLLRTVEGTVIPQKCCPSVDDWGIAYLAKGLSCLERLSLVACHEVQGDLGLTEIGWRRGESLTALSLKDCLGVRAKGVGAVLGGCSRLVELGLAGCASLLAAGGPSLGELLSRCCSPLTNLDISSLSLHDEDIQSLLQHSPPALQSLAHLDLSNSAISDNYFSHLFGTANVSSLPNLEVLAVKNCPRWGPLSMHNLRRRCPNIKELDMTSCGDSDIGGFNFGGVLPLAAGVVMTAALPGWGLQRLALGQCGWLDDHKVARLASLWGPSITDLNLRGCSSITGGALRAIAARCASLSRLDLYNCPHIGDTDIALLTLGCPLLEHLNLASCLRITDTGVHLIARECPKLQEVNLGKLLRVTWDSLGELLGRCQGLEVLDISGCGVKGGWPGVKNGALKTVVLRDTEVTDAGLVQLASGCTSITSLDLSQCRHLSGQGLAALLSSCPRLSTLLLADCPWVGNSELEAIGAHSHRLRTLNLSSCRVSCPGFAALAAGCPDLLSLDLSLCGGGITDESLVALSQGCRMLQSVVLWGCYSVTDLGVAEVAKRCKGLQYLAVVGCNVNGTFLMHLEPGCHVEPLLSLGR